MCPIIRHRCLALWDLLTCSATTCATCSDNDSPELIACVAMTLASVTGSRMVTCLRSPFDGLPTAAGYQPESEIMC